jgi:imidazolonepropionase-like amidohydrolase
MEIGRVRPGWLADLIIVNGNPLENLKVLYPSGTDSVRDGKIVQTGGVVDHPRWLHLSRSDLCRS